MKLSNILMLALAVSSMMSVSACATTQPATEQIGDTVVTSRVGRRLIVDENVKRYQIDVDTIEGVVYLRGKVDTATQKASAERIARDTDGVRGVVNELVVDALTAEQRREENRADLGIKTAVGRALTGDDDVRRVNIDVDVTDGVVTLSGIVHNDAEKMEAGRIAREVDGVRAVENELRVEMHDMGDPEKLGKPDDDDDR